MISIDKKFIQKSNILLEDEYGQNWDFRFNYVHFKITNFKLSVSFTLHEIQGLSLNEDSPNSGVVAEPKIINRLNADVGSYDSSDTFYGLIKTEESLPDAPEFKAVKLESISINIHQDEPENGVEIYADGTYRGGCSVDVSKKSLMIDLGLPCGRFDEIFSLIKDNKDSEFSIGVRVLSFADLRSREYDNYPSLIIPASRRFKIPSYAYISWLNINHNQDLNKDEILRVQVESENEKANIQRSQDLYTIQVPQFLKALNGLKVSVWVVIVLFIIQILKS